MQLSMLQKSPLQDEGMTEYKIQQLAQLLLPVGHDFSVDQRAVIDCWESKEIDSCPGSGKTTVLLAKLKVLADAMPLDNGQGICALSHTNVAINEIKEKFDDDAKRILYYPNFVGTIQTFIDKFIAFPFIRRTITSPLRIVDNREFSYAIERGLKYYPKLRYFLKMRADSSFLSGDRRLLEYIESLERREDGLFFKNKKIAGVTTCYPNDYDALMDDLLQGSGLLRYDDAYKYANDALIEYGNRLRRSLSHRFKYVFVDEYQDCSTKQRDILKQLFDPSITIIQKIGDVDQAIFNEGINEEDRLILDANYLSISHSNRYGEEIAAVLTKLRSNQLPIVSSVGARNINPCLIICNDENRINVLKTFSQLIVKNKLNFNGTFKAVGYYKNSGKIRVGSYWNGFQADMDIEKSTKYEARINRMCIALDMGKVYTVESELRNLLFQVCRDFSVMDDNDQRYNGSSLKRLLEGPYNEIYRSSIIQMISLACYTFKEVHAITMKMLRSLPKIGKIEENSTYFIDSNISEREDSIKKNIYFDFETGISIGVDTVHGVKGETHDATLYLETENKRGTDLGRVLDLLHGRKNSPKRIFEQSRKCVYVGFSRPRYLLCVAIQNTTVQKYPDFFSGWDVIFCIRDFIQ